MTTTVQPLAANECLAISGGLTKHPGIIIVECIPPDPFFSPNILDPKKHDCPQAPREFTIF